MELAKALDVRPGVTAIIGGGGKTTLMECLAEELSAQARVIGCTTTHIYPEQNMPCLVSTSEAEIAAELARTRCVCVGSASESGKYSAPELPFCTLCALASYVIVEADGSKRLPLKAHAPHEPVIPPEANQTILVVGASGFGRPMRESVHRAPIAAQALGVSEETVVTPELWAKFLNLEARPQRGDLQAGSGDLRRPVCRRSRPVQAREQGRLRHLLPSGAHRQRHQVKIQCCRGGCLCPPGTSERNTHTIYFKEKEHEQNC